MTNFMITINAFLVKTYRPICLLVYVTSTC